MDEALRTTKMTDIPTRDRDLFQRFIAKSARGEKPESVSTDEWRLQNLAWFDKHARTIHEIIDNTDNKEIRDFIMAGK